jgi:DNA-binding response OmpR family regulator
MNKSIRVLLVQEEKQLSDIMYNYLSLSFCTRRISNISKIHNFLSETHFHIIILDTKNRYGNSLEVCRYIKKNTSSKVIFISKHDDIDTKERCFESGADDFLKKPFFPKELMIRINKLLGVYNKKEKIECKGLTLNKTDKTLSINNNCVILSNSEYLIIEYMLTNNEIHQTNNLIKYISSEKEKEISVSALTVLIKRLRTKLNKGTGMELIKNRYGRGYYLGI